MHSRQQTQVSCLPFAELSPQADSVWKAWCGHVSGSQTHCGPSFRVSVSPLGPALLSPSYHTSLSWNAPTWGFQKIHVAPRWICKTEQKHQDHRFRRYGTMSTLPSVLSVLSDSNLNGSVRTRCAVWNVALVWRMGLEKIERKHTKIAPTGSSCECPFTWLVSLYFHFCVPHRISLQTLSIQFLLLSFLIRRLEHFTK